VINFALNPKDAVFNGPLPAGAFDLNPHPEAKKTYKFEPVDAVSVTQQR